MKHIICLFLFAFSSCAATYYVDYSTGRDTNNGTSTATAWQHCPGDPNATGTAAGTTPAAGSTIFFKGGVVYRGGVVIPSGGTIGSPITYDGSPAGWGIGAAIMDGSMVIGTAWTVCTNASDAGGNPNFANIWWTTIPAGVSNCLPQLFVNGTNFSAWSQDQTPSDPVFWETLSEFRTCWATNISRSNLQMAGSPRQNSLLSMWEQRVSIM